MDVGVAKAFSVSEHRNACFLLHAGDKRFATARNDEIDQPGCGEHGGYKIAMRRGCHLHGMNGEACFLQAIGNGCMDCGGGVKAVGPATQDHGVATFQADRSGVRTHVRTTLVNHADDADRCRHAPDDKAVRPCPFLSCA